MPERNLDFDRIINRRGTDCLKYDYAVRRGKPADILPLWVADMDFVTSSYIQDALRETAEYGIWGYSQPVGAYMDVLRDWMKRRHNWDINEKWVVMTPGVVFAIAMAIRAFTQPGEGVIIQEPVYYPFASEIRENGRRVVLNELVYDRDNLTYHMDFGDFEKQITDNDVKLFILCNPHNPVGRVWTEGELRTVGEICRKHGVLVVSDEIHSDFIFEGEHRVFTRIDESFADFTITCTAPSKTFNLAGLQLSNIIISNEDIRKKFKNEVSATGYDEPGLFGLRACEAAYAHGEEWLEALLKYLKANLDFMEDYIRSEIPQIRMIRPQGTYLVWLDLKDLGLKPAELESLIVDKAGLWLDRGLMFGASGEGFERINVACPRATLTEALDRLGRAVRGL